MEVYAKYFSRLVAVHAHQIFPGVPRPNAPQSNYHLLENEVHAITQDAEQATKIAFAIDTATEDIFRDFDLSTFMEHFKLDALEKTILAVAIKRGFRQDLKTKGVFQPSSPKALV